MADNRPDVYEDGDVTVYRASSVGQCVRALVASGLGEEEAFGAERKALLERSAAEGNLHEDAVRERLVSEGWDVVSTQEEVEIPVVPGVIVRGHTDGVLAQGPFQVLLEVKSMSTKQFDKWIKKGFREFVKYAWQITCYMQAHPGLNVLYAVKRREDGMIDRTIIPHDEPPIEWKKIKSKILTAESWRRRGELPPCDVKNQWGCPFWYLHEEDGVAEGEIPDDETMVLLQSLLAEYAALKEREQIGDEAADKRKYEINPELMNLIPGDYVHVEVGGETYKVTKSGQTRSWVDLDGMREDGHGPLLDSYTKTKKITYPLVKKVKG